MNGVHIREERILSLWSTVLRERALGVIERLIDSLVHSFLLGENYIALELSVKRESIGSYREIDWFVGSLIPPRRELYRFGAQCQEKEYWELWRDWLIGWLGHAFLLFSFSLSLVIPFCFHSLLFQLLWCKLICCISRLLGQCSQYFDLRCRLLENLSRESL